MRSHYSYLVSINDEPDGSVWVRPHPGRASQKALYMLGQMDPGELTSSLASKSGETAKTL